MLNTYEVYCDIPFPNPLTLSGALLARFTSTPASCFSALIVYVKETGAEDKNVEFVKRHERIQFKRWILISTISCDLRLKHRIGVGMFSRQGIKPLYPEEMNKDGDGESWWICGRHLSG